MSAHRPRSHTWGDLDPDRWVPGPDAFNDDFTEQDWHEAHIFGGYRDPNCSICREGQ